MVFFSSPLLHQCYLLIHWNLILEILLLIPEKTRLLGIFEQQPDSGFFRWSYLNLALFLHPIKKKQQQLRAEKF